MLQKSETGGDLWESHLITDKNGKVNVIALDPGNSNIIYVGGSLVSGVKNNGTIFKSMNSGVSWTELGNSYFDNNTDIQLLMVDPVKSNVLYAGSSTKGLFKSSNDGKTWEKITPTGVLCLEINPKDHNQLFLGSAEGVHISLDGGKTWGQMNQGLDVTNIISLDMNSNIKYLFAGTKGGSVARFHIKDMKPPKKPSMLKAISLKGSKIKLTWKDKSSDEEGFRIERKSGSAGMWKQITHVGSNIRTYTDKGLKPGIQYFYRVYAYNSFGESGFSNIAKSIAK